MKYIFAIVTTLLLSTNICISEVVDPFSNFTRICTQVLCGNTTAETNTTQAAQCRCDRSCHNFGDCCFDAPTAELEHPGITFNTTTCVTIPGMNQSIHVKRFATLQGYSYQCNKSINPTAYKKAGINKVPVTSISNGITYGNYYCALADGRHDNYQFWYLDVRCASINFTIVYKNNSQPKTIFDGNYPSGVPKLKFVSSKWRLLTDNTTEACSLLPRPPENLKQLLRPCDQTVKFINQCSTNSSIQDLGAMKCPGFRSAVRDTFGNWYRNEYCAICNSVNIFNIRCADSNSQKRYKIRPSRFWNFNGLPNYNSIFKNDTSLSSTAGVFNTTSISTTSPTIISKTTIIKSPQATTTPAKKPRKRAYAYLQLEHSCQQVLKTLNFTKVIAETIYYQTINRTYIRNKNTIDGQRIKICSSNSKLKPVQVANIQNTRPVENILLILSNILLFLHFMEFLSPDGVRSLNQKCLANFALMVFLSNFGMLVGDHVAKNHTKYMRIVAIVTYFAIVSTFSWLSCMAFEVPCALLTSMSELKQDENKRFRVYCVICVLVPTFFTSVMCLAQDTIFTFVHQLDGSNQMLFLLYDEILIFMSVSLSFYIFSVYMVKVNPETGIKLSHIHGIDFKLHSILIMLTDLIWICIFLNEDIMSRWLLISYAFLNCLLAFVIYIYSPTSNKVSTKITHYFKNSKFQFLTINSST